MPKELETSEKTQSEWNVDDLIDNPKKYGLPTFEEFSKDPSKWKRGVEELFEVVDRGSTQLNRLIRKHEYRILGYKCDTLEEVQRIMNSEGIRLDDCEIRGDLQTENAGKLKVIVDFVPKNKLTHVT
jgi:hypothetical protein